MPFSPDYIFTSKSRVNYVVNPPLPVYHNPDDNTDWDVESWIRELSDDPEIVNSIWEILGAILRPHVRWNKAAWLYSTSGNNGKGTLCELMRSLVGRGSYASIPIADFGKDFLLEPLIRSQAIIVDENDVGQYLDRAANLKALEYVLWRVLNMNYYTLSEPEACKAALAEYKEYNDPVRQFVSEMLPQCVWDFLPFKFLYDLYKSWLREVSPAGTPVGKTTFTNELLAHLKEDPNIGWY